MSLSPTRETLSSRLPALGSQFQLLSALGKIIRKWQLKEEKKKKKQFEDQGFWPVVSRVQKGKGGQAVQMTRMDWKSTIIVKEQLATS